MWLTLEGTKNGQDLFATTIRLDETPGDIYAEKREAAIEQLGERYVRHASRRVPRGQYEQRETHGADVAATFARIRERLKPASVIIQESA